MNESNEMLKEQAIIIYKNLRHYKPSNAIWERWNYKPANHGKRSGITHYEHALKLIIELLEKGYKVKRGWCSSSMVRTFREYYIFYTK